MDDHVHSYVVWNNKGGTGKTTMVFQLSAEFAKKNEDHKVVVIDLCPQANVSDTLMASKKGAVSKHRQFVYVSVKEECTILKTCFSNCVFEQTVLGYLSAKLKTPTNVPVKGKISFADFLIPIKDNLLLLRGVTNLEDISKELEDERQKSNCNGDLPWRRVTVFIKDLIDDLILENPSKKLAVFIDTNTSFSIFTEMAVSAAKRLIVPFTADDFSLSATEAMLYFIYGYRLNCYPLRQRPFKESKYFELAKTNHIYPPQLHLLVFNRVKILEENPVLAFAAVRGKLETIVKNFYKFYENNFDTLKKCPGFDDIREKYIIDVHDFCSLGVLSLHNGCPISQLQPQTYQFFDKDITIKKDDQRLKNYNIDISKIVDSFARDQKKI